MQPAIVSTLFVSHDNLSPGSLRLSYFLLVVLQLLFVANTAWFVILCVQLGTCETQLLSICVRQ